MLFISGENFLPPTLNCIDYTESFKENSATTTTPLPRMKRRKRNVNCENQFPYVLWRIVNECTSGAIRWAPNGNSILIDLNRFEKQYLASDSFYFKTKKILSFIRQLNIYGFTKISNRTTVLNNSCATFQRADMQSSMSDQFDYHQFKNHLFKQNRFDLLKHFVRRNSDIIKQEKTKHFAIQSTKNKLSIPKTFVIINDKQSKSPNLPKTIKISYPPAVFKDITNTN